MNTVELLDGFRSGLPDLADVGLVLAAVAVFVLLTIVGASSATKANGHYATAMTAFCAIFVVLIWLPVCEYAALPSHFV